jgi:hypothetical protein
VLDIRFHPECDLAELVEAAAEYQRLWNHYRERILEGFRVVTGLEHAEGLINAIVWHGGSETCPLRFRAVPPEWAGPVEEFRRGVIVHELSHRLIRGNRARLGMPPYQPDRQRENHELIDLFLFDVWTDLFGEEFARRRAAAESRSQPFYREAWEATLALDRPARAAKLAAVLHPNG